MPGYTCAFRGCHSKTGGGLALFAFPKDQTGAKLWLQACCRTDLMSKTAEQLYSNYKLCELHFEDKCYSVGASRKCLLPNAHPTLFPSAIKRPCVEQDLEEAPPKKTLNRITIF
ncbi:unnamed protein product [Callosobruchus maculatus]|uniref:THAP-type domain-containing protein n=1 Tax=Callosobruchus maculatus TaxID=64391 RepID=A0A653BU31_CALMS|nr:unnamed protein product [Callosobruchus maculatus]